MAKQRPSVIKRQREQVRRERQQMKAAKRLERKNSDGTLTPDSDVDPSIEGVSEVPSSETEPSLGTPGI